MFWLQIPSKTYIKMTTFDPGCWLISTAAYATGGNDPQAFIRQTKAEPLMFNPVKIFRRHLGAVPAYLVSSLGLLAPHAAWSAPFCVQTQALPPQCIFFDANSCATRAQQLGGTCSVNKNEVRVSAGLGHYCLMTSTLVSSCIYANLDQCNKEATHQRGVCVLAPHRPESPALDPYRDTRPAMAGG